MIDHTRATLARKSYARCYKVTMDLSDEGKPEGAPPPPRKRRRKASALVSGYGVR